jgi:hypothetical protein
MFYRHECSGQSLQSVDLLNDLVLSSLAIILMETLVCLAPSYAPELPAQGLDLIFHISFPEEDAVSCRRAERLHNCQVFRLIPALPCAQAAVGGDDDGWPVHDINLKHILGDGRPLCPLLCHRVYCDVKVKGWNSSQHISPGPAPFRDAACAYMHLFRASKHCWLEPRVLKTPGPPRVMRPAKGRQLQVRFVWHNAPSVARRVCLETAGQPVDETISAVRPTDPYSSEVAR